MTARGEVIARSLAQVQEAGTLYLHGNPSAKSSLLDAIKVLQQEIESPAEYLSKARFSVPYHDNHLDTIYICAANLPLGTSPFSICASLWLSRWDFLMQL